MGFRMGVPWGKGGSNQHCGRTHWLRAFSKILDKEGEVEDLAMATVAPLADCILMFL